MSLRPGWTNHRAQGVLVFLSDQVAPAHPRIRAFRECLKVRECWATQ